MEIVIALLAVIAGAEVYLSYLIIRKPSKKRYFNGKLQGTRNMIWDFEFKVFKTREIREDIRQQYDQMLSRIEGYKTQLENWPAEQPEEDKKRVEDLRTLAERDAERFLKQMQMLDAEIEGVKPTVENQGGQVGVSEQIDSLREVEGMLKDYVKTL